jgi:hypothetical protein
MTMPSNYALIPFDLYILIYVYPAARKFLDLLYQSVRTVVDPL